MSKNVLKKKRKKIFYHIKCVFSDGCPCMEFDCSILDELAEACSDLNSNENYQICYEKEKGKLNACLDGCDDSVCQKICSHSFHGALENCPCGAQCPCKSSILESKVLFKSNQSFEYLIHFVKI